MSDYTAKIIGITGTLVCLSWLLLKIVILISHIIWFRPRDHRIPYIRNYKKGSFVTNYLVMMFIFFIGILYDERNLFFAISSSITEAFDFIVLKLDTSHVAKLMADYPLYKITVYTGYCFIIFGTILLSVSIMQQHIWNAFMSFLSKKTSKDMLYLFGYNKDNLRICKSDGKKRFKYIIAKLDKEALEKLYIDGLPYISTDAEEWVEKHLTDFLQDSNKKSRFGSFNFMPRSIRKHEKNKIVIINTENDKQNTTICKIFVDAIASLSADVHAEIFGKLRIFVFGDPKYQAIYDNLTERGMGCITYINKYQKIAMDFIDKYPLTLFMDCKQIDYETSLVREGVDINVALIGFGKTNRQVLLSSVAINQFLTSSAADKNSKSEKEENQETVCKPVKYFVFDKNHTDQNKNLNHDYFRFRHKLKNMDFNEYLPMPPTPAEETYVCIDINDSSFYPYLKKIITKSKRDANFIVIAFGDDLENLDMAQKLVEKCKEWDTENVTIFVRAFDWCKDETPLKDKNCYFFGNETTSVFDIEKLLSDKIYEMAKMRNKAIDMERALTRANYQIDNENYQKISQTSEDELWYKKKTQIQRDSRIYACLGLRFKLNLMGLDYREKNSGGENNNQKVYNEEEYLNIYAKDDLPDTETIKHTVNGKKIVYYNGEYTNSRRRNMAIQEHCRWSSFIISKGVVPATVHKILTETKEVDGKKKRTSGKNYSLRRHGNLTSYKGLADFSKLISYDENGSETQNKEYEKDRYRYRYQILDDAYWLLDSNEFEIISKISCRDNKTCDKIHGCIECTKSKINKPKAKLEVK